MSSPGKRALVVLLVLAVANTAYAFAVPGVLDELVPSKPFGYYETDSPTADAETSFVDVTNATGIEHTRFEWGQGSLPYPAVVTGGVAAADVEGDGDVDLYFPPGGPNSTADLYLNEGNLSFEEATEDAGLEATGFGAGAAFGDYDNDGDPDLYTAVGGHGLLYENRGNATFENVTAGSGTSLAEACGPRPCQPTGLAWTDVNGDGLLDLYVVNNLDWRQPGLHTSGEDYASLIYFAERQDAILLINENDGTFREATDEFGVPNTGKGLGVTPADVDGDGWPDLATANDITENALYLNQEGSGFVDVAPEAGVNEVKTSMGIVARDVTGDGKADLLVTNFRGDKLSLLVQESPSEFRYATEERGLGATWEGTGWGVAAFDYDLDSWLDVGMAVGRAVPLNPHVHDLDNIVFEKLVENREDQLYRNMGEGSFAEVTDTAGEFAGRTNTRGFLAVDLDGDGDQDVVRVNLQGDRAEILENRLDNDNQWLRLDLVGTESNRDGFGARVEVTVPGGRTLTRQLVSADGFQTGNPSRLTVGLGDHDRADVTVHWPSGLTQDLGELETGSHVVVEGEDLKG